MTTYIASTTTDLTQLLSTVKGGDRIELRGGDYGEVLVRNVNFASDVVITAYADEKPSFGSIVILNSSHLAFDGVAINFQPDASTSEWSSAFKVRESSSISVRNSDITGGVAIAGIDANAAAGTQGSSGINGLPIGVGVSVYESTNISIEDNVISKFSAGIRFSNTSGIDITDNEIFNVRKVPVGGGGVDNVNMSGNYFHDLMPWKFGGLGDHGDFVHFWTNPDQKSPSSNFVFESNIFAQGNGTAVLGIYLDNNKNDSGFKNVTINDNIIHNGNSQSMRLEDVTGLVITNNTMIQSSGEPRDAPSIYLDHGNSNVIINNNIFAGVYGPGMVDMANNRISILDNFAVQIFDPRAENFVGNVLVNGFANQPTLADLSTLPGGIADGYGASIAVRPATYIAEARGEGLSIHTHTFSVSDDRASQVIWDFGDGKTGQGHSVVHSYSIPGTYQAHAIITLEDGTNTRVTKTLEVLSPVALQADFDDGLAGTQIVGDVEIVNGQNGKAIKLANTNSTVTFEANDAMRNNSEYTISLAFKKDLGSETLGGRILYFSGTAVIDLVGDGLALRAKTDIGEDIVLKAPNIGLANSNWHQVTYTFSQADGTAILYLDGSEVTRVGGLKGSQFTTMGHDFHLGNPFGQNFAGILDEAAFLRAALSPDQVRESFQAFVNSADMLNYHGNDSLDVVAESAKNEELQNQQAESESSLDPSPDPIVEKTTDPNVLLGGRGVACSIARDDLEELLSGNSFNIAMRLASAKPYSSGEIARLHESFIISITKAGELEFKFFTKDGHTTNLISQGADLNSGQTRNICISLKDGLLIISVDESIVASTRMVASLSDIGNHDLTIGNPWHDVNYSGVLSKFDITSKSGLLAGLDLNKAPVEIVRLGHDIVAYNIGESGFDRSDDGSTIDLPEDAGGIDLGGKGVAASIGRNGVDDILLLDNFQIAMNLTADKAGSSGEVVRLHSSFLINVDPKGDLDVQVFSTEEGRIRLHTEGARINDAEEHAISLTLNNGILSITVDGAVMASTEMTGALVSIGSHDLTFGNPWGKENFDGHISSFRVSVKDDWQTIDNGTEVLEIDAAPVVDHPYAASEMLMTYDPQLDNFSAYL